MWQHDEAKSGPRKRRKKSNNIFTVCFGIICDDDDYDDDEERRPLKLPKLPPPHDGMSTTTTRSVVATVKKKKKRASCSDVESEKAEAQMRYEMSHKKLHNLIIPSSSSSNSNNPTNQTTILQTTSTQVVAQNNPTSEKSSSSLAAPSSRTIYKIKSSNRKTTGRAAGAGAKKLDPVLGFSVVMVTMVIMILWGRLCAILCTSAWFYFTSKFKSSTTAYPTAAGDPPLRLDLESEEHKKKVVLQGFLERKRR